MATFVIDLLTGKELLLNKTLTPSGATKPFKVVTYHLAPSNDENTLTRLSADNGSTYFVTDIFATKKDKATGSGDATDFIFNTGTRISASVWSPVADRTVNIWLTIQEI